jgi:hypothetical protein
MFVRENRLYIIIFTSCLSVEILWCVSDHLCLPGNKIIHYKETGLPPFYTHTMSPVFCLFSIQVITHQPALLTNPLWARVVGYGPFSLCVIHNEGLCPSSGDIKRRMMIQVKVNTFYLLTSTNK